MILIYEHRTRTVAELLPTNLLAEEDLQLHLRVGTRHPPVPGQRAGSSAGGLIAKSSAPILLLTTLGSVNAPRGLPERPVSFCRYEDDGV